MLCCLVIKPTLGLNLISWSSDLNNILSPIQPPSPINSTQTHPSPSESLDRSFFSTSSLGWLLDPKMSISLSNSLIRSTTILRQPQRLRILRNGHDTLHLNLRIQTFSVNRSSFQASADLEQKGQAINTSVHFKGSSHLPFFFFRFLLKDASHQFEQFPFFFFSFFFEWNLFDDLFSVGWWICFFLLF